MVISFSGSELLGFYSDFNNSNSPICELNVHTLFFLYRLTYGYSLTYIN